MKYQDAGDSPIIRALIDVGGAFIFSKFAELVFPVFAHDASLHSPVAGITIFIVIALTLAISSLVIYQKDKLPWSWRDRLIYLGIFLLMVFALLSQRTLI
jgi:hypothetical protein